MNSASVDLIYLDPPFNSKADYAAPIGSQAAGAAFKDTWTWSDLDMEWVDQIKAKHPRLRDVILAAMTKSDESYLVYMGARLLEMHRILKPTGSIYLHCDPTMSHYLKLVMDAIFGRSNFRREIVWSNEDQSGFKSKAANWIRGHDTILYYTKTDKVTFNKEYKPLDEKTIRRYDKIDEDGRRYKIYYNPDRSERRSYLKADRGTAIPSVWADMASFQKVNNTGEYTGYPTQKPLALLDRIIRASSNKGDIVFDPFCGCATTLVAADRINRNWVGIDISPKAVDLVKQRLAADAPKSPLMPKSKSLLSGIIHRTDLLRRTDLDIPLRYNHPDNRKRLYGEQAGFCNGCGIHFQQRNLTIDHIIARDNGGSDHISNLQLLCGACNSKKGTRDMADLKKELRTTLHIAA